MDGKLTLENTKGRVRQCEAVQEHQEILNSGLKAEKTLDLVQGTRNKYATNKKPLMKMQAYLTSNGKCRRCGKAPHAKQV